MRELRIKPALRLATMLALTLHLGLVHAAAGRDEVTMQYLLGKWSAEVGGKVVERWEFTAEPAASKNTNRCIYTTADGEDLPTQCRYEARKLATCIPRCFRSGGEMEIIDENHFTDLAGNRRWTRMAARSGSNGIAAKQLQKAAGAGPQGAWERAQAALRADEKPLTFDNMAPLLPTAIADRIRQEADDVVRGHTRNRYLQRTYDSECKKEEYLKERMAWPTWDGKNGRSSLDQQSGHVDTVRAIHERIAGRCFAEKGSLSEAFDTCMSRFLNDPKNKRYCVCTAEKFNTAWADVHRVAAARGDSSGISSYAQSRLMADAYTGCQPYRKY